MMKVPPHKLKLLSLGSLQLHAPANGGDVLKFHSRNLCELSLDIPGNCDSATIYKAIRCKANAHIMPHRTAQGYASHPKGFCEECAPLHGLAYDSFGLPIAHPSSKGAQALRLARTCLRISGCSKPPSSLDLRKMESGCR
eukprot:6755585-Pyramimonas_sp.AAC.1